MHAIVQCRRTREFRGFIPLTQVTFVLKLCPVRAGGHECGCLPVLARMVMEHCIARLYVAMFNAIRWESALEIPTDPVSDPIVDSKVLPILAGDLSFGSGAQLKNSICIHLFVGNWSRWLTDMFSMDVEDCLQDQESGENDESRDNDSKPKSFLLLNDLSDLLMLPKDMLMDKQVRREVCPSITLLLIIRVLYNFTPDEFCPDPVPGIVLKSLHEEVANLRERQTFHNSFGSMILFSSCVARMVKRIFVTVSRAVTAWKLVLAGNEQGNEH
ncbi:uncharacterized protein [Arachis hypogaea]|uniref:uncharacterized protein n=1 Tax=Arachis hypogaea TaxID=3818 RepID=UPI003B2204B0